MKKIKKELSSQTAPTLKSVKVNYPICAFRSKGNIGIAPFWVQT